MQLTAITVENYRSITKAYKIRLGQSTVLLGPNNEGKSNVLLALVTAMNALIIEQREGADVFVGRYRINRFYDWHRDFPIHLQTSKPKGQSVIILDCGLSANERAAFRKEVGSDITGTLPIKVALGPKSVTASFHKKGRWAKAVSEKSPRLAAFVSKRLRFEHIPAVRTAKSAHTIVEQLVARELQNVESNVEYQKVVARLAALQEPVLKALSDNIKKTLVQFLPDVNEVRIEISREERYRALRQSCTITVDDGTATELQYKGDGVQSLAALAIMRHASQQSAQTMHSVIAIEEPESHLHPAAIHQLRSVLAEMSGIHQIVLTTHNPLFVDRVNVASNIIVNDKKAKPAKTIEEVRDVLGVLAADNLRSAALVLVVEGEDDRVALTALLRVASGDIAAAMASGMLAVDSLQGASNLAYKLGVLRASLCNVHCFLDSDTAGKVAVENAVALALVGIADVTMATCPGRSESELEDLYDVSVYAAPIRSRYGVALTGPKFQNAKKWSVRMQDTFTHQGKPWSDKLKAEVKLYVANQIASNSREACVANTRGAFDALVDALSAKLRNLSAGRSVSPSP